MPLYLEKPIRDILERSMLKRTQERGLVNRNLAFAPSQTFAALRHRNYRLWFTGQLISLVGTWMQVTAQGYLVYELTSSPAYLGYVGFASGFPIWMLTFYAGVAADYIPRRTLLIIAQTAMMLLAFIQAGLVFAGLIQPWHIIVLSLLLGVCNAFDAPARHSFVAELVEREDLTNAIALNSTLFNAALVVGPAVAGFTYALFGAGWCFTLNGISFIGVIAALLMMRIQKTSFNRARKSAFSNFKEGIQYIRSRPLIVLLLANLMTIGMLVGGMVYLLPAWAVNVLGGDVTTNGFLMSARGAGALLGALIIATSSRLQVRGRLWTLGSLVMPCAMLAFSFARWLPLSLALLVVFGWAFMTQINSTNAMVQTRTDDQMRGRVMSVYSLMILGGMPLGSLIIGWAATFIGEPLTVMISATILLAFAVAVYIRRPDVRAVGS